jgi:hypothetical protein
MQRSLAPQDPGKDRWGRPRRAPSPLYFARSRKLRAKALGLARAYIDNQIAFIREIKAYETKFSRRMPNGVVSVANAYPKLPDAANRLRVRAKLDRKSSQSQVGVVAELFRFTFMGWADPDRSDQTSSYYRYAPPLGYLDKKRGNKVMAMLESGYKRAHKASKKKAGRSYDATRLLELWSDYFFFIGEREKGVSKLQELVDRYPEKASRYEKQIERELGMKSDNSRKDRERYAKGLKTCDDMDLAVGMRTIISERVRLRGFAGVEQTVDEIVRACKRSKQAKRVLQRIYRKAALNAGSYGLCKEFNKYMSLAVQHGQSAREAGQYRKNWTICQ